MRDSERLCNIGGGTVLDFGCGNGGFLKLLKEKEKKVCGVELEENARQKITSEGIEVRSDIDEYEGFFDFITSFHVIEHLVNPSEFLEKIRRHMKSGSRLIIETPNADDALLSLYGSRQFADFTYWSCHVILYNLDTLSVLLEKNHFNVIKKEQIQRYPLANHLYWLSKGGPGGQNKWDFLNDAIMNERYAELLAERGLCDTIIVTCEITGA